MNKATLKHLLSVMQLNADLLKKNIINGNLDNCTQDATTIGGNIQHCINKLNELLEKSNKE